LITSRPHACEKPEEVVGFGEEEIREFLQKNIFLNEFL